jgi:hypothetical protein
MMRWRPEEGNEELRAQLDEANAKLAKLEEEHSRCDAQVRELQERNMSLVQLSVASQLLCGGTDREEVLNAIEEIIINMIGSEEIAILELLDEGRVRVARTRGIDGKTQRFDGAAAAIREAIKSGHVVLPGGREITAVIPLKMDSSTFGVVTVFRLLEQKPALDALDHELLDLVARQGAVAIFSAAFRSLRPTVRPPTKVSR